ncbi:MAG TPA: CHAT domain-containing protein [Bacteroidota bacterium]|nr:CHAT domain-containing protein [Bacteroidota bacterium]
MAAVLIAGCGESESEMMRMAVAHNEQSARLYNQQSYVKALTEINQAISLNSQLKRDSALGENYLLQALCQRKLGQYDSSISAFKISVEYFRLVGDQRLERRGRVALAELLYALRRYREALSLASNTAGESKVFSDSSNVTEALLVVAKASHRMHNFSREISVLEELSAMNRQSGSEAGPGELMKMSFMASVAAGDRDGLRDTFNRWKAYAATTAGGSAMAQVHASWGRYQYTLNHLDSALHMYSQALSLINEASSRKLQTEILTALGTIAYRSGRYDDARLYFNDAQTASHQENDLLREQLLKLMVLACDWKAAKSGPTPELVKRCAEIAASAHQVGFRLGETFAWFVKGMLDARSGDTSASKKAFIEASRLDEQNIVPDGEMYPTVEVIDAFMDGERCNWDEPLLEYTCTPSGIDEAFRLTERSNLRDFQRFFSQSAIRTGDVNLDHQIAAYETRRKSLRLLEEDIYEELSSGKYRNLERFNILNGLYAGRVQDLAADAQSLEGKNIRWLLSSPTLSLRAIRDTLSPKTVLLEYVTLADELEIIVAMKDTAILRSKRVPEQRLLSLIAEYNRLIGDPRLHLHAPNFDEAAAIGRVHELSSVLYTILVEPIISLIGAGAEIDVVLPPEFGWLPVHTLRIAGSTPLINKFPIKYLPSAAVLLFHAKEEKFVREVVGLGHPGQTNWDVEYELKDIRSFYDKARMFFDTAATLPHLGLSPYDVLNIAAEFKIDTAVPDNSAIALSDNTTSSGVREVPLGEMLSIPIPPALVFSNISPAAGGLSRYAPMLFLAGGTRTVIVTMWQGERKAKKYFGEVFYTDLMSGTPASAAYHHAMTAMTKSEEFSRIHRWGLYYQFGR